MQGWATMIGALAILILSAADILAAEPDPLDLAAPPAGAVHHPIETSNPEAQTLFDRGLALVWAFNHVAAAEAFARAAALDPQAPMPQWGIALAHGSDLNVSAFPDDLATAGAAIERAAALAVQGNARERAYITALAARYAEPPLEALGPYEAALAALVEQYPEDLTAKVLHAEAAMLAMGMHHGHADDASIPAAEIVISELDEVLATDPNHVGANHLYIHALESSPDPGRAAEAAARLAATAGNAGHLLHMPAHVQVRLGDFAGCAASNEAAAAADEAYLKASGAAGVYPFAYAGHNYQFLIYCEQMAGRKAAALSAADRLVAHLARHGRDLPFLEMYGIDTLGMLPILAAARFGDWERVLGTPAPPTGARVATALYHHARGLAFLGQGRRAEAEEERAALAALLPAIGPTDYYGHNAGRDVAGLASAVLDAHLAAARGRLSKAIVLFQRAVAAEDALVADEPPAWYAPVREALGAALLAAGQADEAAAVFRAELTHHPGSGRALWGLWQSLEASDDAGATKARAAFEAAWTQADVQLALDGL